MSLRSIFQSSIKTKISIGVSLSVLAMLSVLIGFSNYRDLQGALRSEEEKALNLAQFYQQRAKSELEKALNYSQTLAQMFASVKDTASTAKLGRAEANAMLKNLMATNHDFFGIGIFFEPNQYDGRDADFRNTPGHNEHGTFIPYWFTDGAGHYEMVPYDPYTSDFYLRPKADQLDMVMDPYLFDTPTEQVLITTFISPILYDSTFHGVAGCDVWLQDLVGVVWQAHPYDSTALLYLFSNNGTIVATNKDRGLTGQPGDTLFADMEQRLEGIAQGEQVSLYHDDMLEVRVPLRFGNTTTPWQVGMMVPKRMITADAYAKMNDQILLSALFLLLTLAVVASLTRRLLKPLGTITTLAHRMAQGDFARSGTPASTGREITQLNAAFDTLVQAVGRQAEFARQIGKGNFEAFFEPMGQKDILGQSLLEMKQSLALAREKDRVQAEKDHIENWKIAGIARANQLFRESFESQEQLCQRALELVVRYLDLIQGGVFVLENDPDGEPVNRLVAAFAYGRKKLMEKEFAQFEGLVGRCVFERESIYMDDVPNDYIEIRSGLGGLHPRAILLVPLLYHGEPLGVLEFAAMERLAPHKRELADELGRIWAGALNTFRINQRTKDLLAQSQQQAIELMEREEELYQNLEEIKAIQEGAQEREAEMTELLDILVENLPVAVVGRNGIVERLGVPYAKLLKKRESFHVGFDFRHLHPRGKDGKAFDLFWEQATQLPRLDFETELLIDDQKYILKESVHKILDEYDSPVRYVFLIRERVPVESSKKISS